MTNTRNDRGHAPHRSGDVLVGVLALAPLLWFAAAAGLPDPAEPATLLRYLGRLTGVLGLAWLLIAMLLSIRLPVFEGPFGGLIRLWHIHHVLGAGSFLLLLLHPVLLALAAAADGPAAALATLAPPLAYWPAWVGWGGLLLMMAFMAPSFAFFGEPDYQRWKAVHLLSAGAAVLGLVHAVVLASGIPPGQAVWLWAVFGGLGAAGLVWRKVLSPIVARRPHTITRVDALARGVVEISFEPEGAPLRHAPGQFVYLTPLDPTLPAGRGEEHPYSISSAPGEPALRIAIKALGDASSALLDVRIGSRALIEGPYGRFLPRSHERPALWIGGGIGLTPFVAAARTLARSGGVADIHLVYCANDVSRAYFLDELTEIAAGVPGFTVHTHYFDDEGSLDQAFVAARVSDFTSRRAYICGPLQLIAVARQLLHQAGVPRSRITSEEFALL
jgi:predicted ferric reductase